MGVENSFQFYSLIAYSFTPIESWNWIFALRLVLIRINYGVTVIILFLFTRQTNSSPKGYNICLASKIVHHKLYGDLELLPVLTH